MNAEYLWGSFMGTFWTDCIVLGIERITATKWHGPTAEGYRIIFWDTILEDFVERVVPKGSLRFIVP